MENNELNDTGKNPRHVLRAMLRQAALVATYDDPPHLAVYFDPDRVEAWMKALNASAELRDCDTAPFNPFIQTLFTEKTTGSKTPLAFCTFNPADRHSLPQYYAYWLPKYEMDDAVLKKETVEYQILKKLADKGQVQHREFSELQPRQHEDEIKRMLQKRFEQKGFFRSN